jgi:hypothetical protein
MGSAWSGGMRVPPGEDRDTRWSEILIGNPIPVAIQPLVDDIKGWAFAQTEPNKPYQFYLNAALADDGSWAVATNYQVEPPVE